VIRAEGCDEQGRARRLDVTGRVHRRSERPRGRAATDPAEEVGSAATAAPVLLGNSHRSSGRRRSLVALSCAVCQVFVKCPEDRCAAYPSRLNHRPEGFSSVRSAAGRFLTANSPSGHADVPTDAVACTRSRASSETRCKTRREAVKASVMRIEKGGQPFTRSIESAHRKRPPQKDFHPYTLLNG
jgi:hypothetical protein